MEGREVSEIMVKTNELYEKLLNEYFGNCGAKIRRISDSVLKKLQFKPDYVDDFYSLAGENFPGIYKKWEKSFDNFLYSCLLKRFMSRMTYVNAEKRGGPNKTEVSINQKIGDDLTIEDTIGEDVSGKLFSRDSGN